MPYIKEHRNEEDMVELGVVHILQLSNGCQQNLSFGYNYYFSTLSTQLSEFNLLQTEVLFKVMFPTVRYALKIRTDKKVSLLSSFSMHWFGKIFYMRN